MTNADTILSTLDGLLDQPVDITIYGRAALQLGFTRQRPEYAVSMDVDVVLWSDQAEILAGTTSFWDAVEETNRRLASGGLYISHFFDETQVILTPEWRSQRLPVQGPWRKLILHRLGNGDLLLSKMMRVDPQDLDDARFIIRESGLTSNDIRSLVARARIPDSAELREQFQLCSSALIGEE
jgi:hypothetical protein